MSDFTIPGSNDQPIYGNTHLPDGEPTTAVLLCHGFKGYKDYGFFPRLASSLAEAGCIAHRFNFSHSGMTNNTDTFERPDLFEADTWGKQLDDLFTVAKAAAAGELPGHDAGLQQVWFGHSRGGVTAILAAHRASVEGRTPRPAALVTASAPDYACNMDEPSRAALREEGSMESPSGRTGQRLRVGRAWLDEIEADPDRFDPTKCLPQVTCPLLIIHGDHDPTVPVRAAHNLAAVAKGETQLHIIEQTQHTFDCPNPLPDNEKPPPATQQMINTVTRFTSTL